MQLTRAALIAWARKLTAERGLAGFTVEELCENVGISRRTFFNYFATKEDAVIGDPADFLPDDEYAAFVARGAGDHAGLSPTLLHDLVDLVVDHHRRKTTTRQDHALFRDIVRTEPHLLVRLVAASESHQQVLTRAIAEREGLPDDHPLPRIVVGVVLAVTFRTVDQFYADDNHSPFEDLLIRNMGYAQQLLAQNLPSPTGRP